MLEGIQLIANFTLEALPISTFQAAGDVSLALLALALTLDVGLTAFGAGVALPCAF